MDSVHRNSGGSTGDKLILFQPPERSKPPLLLSFSLVLTLLGKTTDGRLVSFVVAAAAVVVAVVVAVAAAAVAVLSLAVSCCFSPPPALIKHLQERAAKRQP
jgi:hypothetical protein